MNRFRLKIIGLVVLVVVITISTYGVTADMLLGM